MPIQNGEVALTWFIIMFDERMPQRETMTRLHKITDTLWKGGRIHTRSLL